MTTASTASGVSLVTGRLVGRSAEPRHGGRWVTAGPSGRSWGWLSGLGLNLVLAVLYLCVAPLTETAHGDWAIIVGSYFAGFVLADSTTTNALGADAGRVSHQLRAGTPLRRILLAKNRTLMLVVGLPTLTATALITLHDGSGDRLVLTVPAVLLPILTWLGLGNLVSVLLPVAVVPLRWRWEQRRDVPSTGRWLLGLVLPYALCLVVDPLTTTPTPLLHLLALDPGDRPALAGAVLLVGAAAGYAGLTWVALQVARRRDPGLPELARPARRGFAAAPASALAA